MTDHREIAVEVTVAAPREAVWRALRDRTELHRWHGWDYPELDAEIEEIYFAQASADEAAGTLRTGGSLLEVEQVGAGSVVRAVLALPPDDPSWEGWYDDIREGWTTFVQQLRYALERHPGDDRATVFVSGTPLDGAQPGAAELLGLGGLPAVGERYAVTAATGDELAGEVWFRSAHQLGVTVDGWGDGLLVLTGRPSPAGAEGAVLSTYGLEDMEVTRLEERWRSWWAQRHASGDPAP